jgi:predicted peroxiredoxin
MNEQSGSLQKYLINCQDGSNNPERATISMILAFTASKTCETALFVSADAVQLCVKGGAESITAEGYEPLSSLLSGYLENGGHIWLCPACAKAKGITEDDLIAGVEIAGAPKTMAFLSSGGQLLA